MTDSPSGSEASGAAPDSAAEAEARQAQDALRRSEERLRLVIENTREYAIFSTDLDRVITSWNIGAERLLGYAEAEALGRSADMIFTEEDRRAGAPAAEAAMATLNERASDVRYHQRKDGSRFWSDGLLMRMHDDSGRAVGFVKVLRDNTAAREAQEALERSQAQLRQLLADNQAARAELEAADAAKDRFIAVLSHELRNPLASIGSAAQLLADPAAGADRRAQAVQVVQRQVRNMQRLVDDLLDVSRLAVGKFELRRTSLPVAEIVASAVETAQPLIDAAHHRLQVRLPDEALTVHVDPLRIGQALVNLLTNAARYTPPGGDIALTVQREANVAMLTVADTGIGMESPAIERMFELYRQGPRPARAQDEGLGVGLALVRSIVTLHGGTVEASSAGPGRGSEFRIRLPLVHAGAAPTPSPDTLPGTVPGTPLTPPRAAPASGEPRRRLLLADDNVDATWALGQLLTLAGHEALFAASGREALATAERERPDAIVLDIGMPDLDGLEVARRLRAAAWCERVPIIALSGWTAAGDGAREQAAFDAHLVKPVEPAQLMATIERCLAARAAGG